MYGGRLLTFSRIRPAMRSVPRGDGERKALHVRMNKLFSCCLLTYVFFFHSFCRAPLQVLPVRKSPEHGAWRGHLRHTGRHQHFTQTACHAFRVHIVNAGVAWRGFLGGHNHFSGEPACVSKFAASSPVRKGGRGGAKRVVRWETTSVLR